MSEKSRTRGRPRKFDPDEVLGKALNTFRQNGYSGTSLEDLTNATGLNRPSLYGTFGNKHKLYEAALDSYWSRVTKHANEGLWETGDIKRDFHSFLLRFLDGFCDEEPGGCVIACSLPSEAGRDPVLEKKLQEIFEEADTTLTSRFEEARKKGQLETDVPINMLAQLISSTMFGMSIRSRAGASRAELETMVEGICKLLFVL